MKNTFVFDTVPENESERISALREYGILEGPHEAAFDHIVELTAQLFEVPIAIITLVETNTVYAISGKGMGNINSEARKTSICSLTILREEITVFEDAAIEPCLLANPWVAGEFGLKFYAGAPLTTPNGLRIGTICLLDIKPRLFNEKDELILKNMAKIVISVAELKKTKSVEELSMPAM